GAWHKLRTDPILRFLVVSLSFYGMSTFEGPMMSIKTVNALSHNTDWTIGHVHSGALGWVAMISIGAIYHLIPKLWGMKAMYSTSLINEVLNMAFMPHRSEEHTSELQTRENLVCRLLLEKKKTNT